MSTVEYIKFSETLLSALEFVIDHVMAARGPGQVSADAANHLTALKNAHADFVETLAPPAGIVELHAPVTPAEEPPHAPATGEQVMADIESRFEPEWLGRAESSASISSARAALPRG